MDNEESNEWEETEYESLDWGDSENEQETEGRSTGSTATSRGFTTVNWRLRCVGGDLVDIDDIVVIYPRASRQCHMRAAHCTTRARGSRCPHLAGVEGSEVPCSLEDADGAGIA